MLLTAVCQALNHAKVRYAVVGGYAVALHGAVRGTVDLDLVLALTEKSFIDAEAALKRLGMEPRLPVTARQVFQFRDEYVQSRNLVAWSFYDPSRGTYQVDIIVTHDLRKMRVAPIRVQGIRIPLLELQDLIRMKRQSGRPQDLEDVKALQALQKGKRNGHE